MVKDGITNEAILMIICLKNCNLTNSLIDRICIGLN